MLRLFRYNASIYIDTEEEELNIIVSVYFLVTVIVCNFCKAAVMAIVLLVDSSTRLVTLGDAASSYLERPEALTHGKSLSSKPGLLSSHSNQLLQGVNTQI